MKFLSIVMVSFFLFSCARKEHRVQVSQQNKLLIYATNNCLCEDDWQKQLQQYAIDHNFVLDFRFFSSGSQMLDYYLNERDSLEIVDILLGLDNTNLSDIQSANILRSYKPFSYSALHKSILIDKNNHFLPLAYSYLAFLYDSNELVNPPVTFGEMQDGIWKKKIIILDPTTSGLGRSMLYWSLAAFGENGYGHFWRSIKENVFAICNNFDEAYSMFLAHEAPLVIAWSTTPVYHQRIKGSDKIKAIIPREGGYMYIQGMGICCDSPNPELAERLIDFLVSRDFQVHIPFNKWMYPANTQVKLPPEFESAVQPIKDLTEELTPKIIQRRHKHWLERWLQIMH
ncbi:MAG: thiamine ABC transporter substrate-binding protein [Candidatus Cloacimonetes bacterium]|nr:thiamine ABC transporter substrate-binding protein [Candidatus Cloacimonadota bacterium]